MSARFEAPPGLAALTSLVRDCTVSGISRWVLLLRADLLPSRTLRPHHLRLAQEAIEPLQNADRGRLYELSHDRVAISWRGQAAEQLGQALEALEHLMSDAPMDSPSVPELVRLFELPRDGAAVLALASSPSMTEQQQQEVAASAVRDVEVAPPLDLTALGAVEARLAHAGVARFARRGLVCRMGASALSPAWETRFLSIDELMGELNLNRNVNADPWLLRRLTRTLERRMLALLSSAAELRGAGPFGIDLNLGGILSPEFLRFDTALPTGLRGQIVLNLDPADVMGDLRSYRFARAFVAARGYRVLLRGITPTLLPVLDIKALDVDFIELQWCPTLETIDPAVLWAGSARWVLTEVDSVAGVRWGTGMGIGLFRGPVIQPGPLTREERDMLRAS